MGGTRKKEFKNFDFEPLDKVSLKIAEIDKKKEFMM